MTTATAIETKNALEVRNLNFYYGKFQGLKNINLDSPEKQVTAFIGPSGCGKSTLLRIFNRMYELYPEQRAEGSITLDGEDYTDGECLDEVWGLLTENGYNPDDLRRPE